MSYDPCLLECRTIVHTVQDVVDVTNRVLDFQNIQTDFVIKGVRFRSGYLMGGLIRLCLVTDTAPMHLGSFDVLSWTLRCPQHLYQSILGNVSEVTVQSPDRNSSSSR